MLYLDMSATKTVLGTEFMKKIIQYYAALLLLGCFLSCNGQQKTASEKTNTSPPKEAIAVQEDVDPYFTESSTISSAYGPNSITRNMLQDKKGNIWFATWEGIFKYDGKTFTNYTNKENLRRFHVFSLLEDTKGNLWFGTIGAGIYRYDGTTFTNFTTEDGLAHNSIGCFMEDENGLLWIGTMNGISAYDGKSFTNYKKEEGLVSSDVNTIVADKTGKLWIGTRGQTYLYDGKTFTEIKTPDGKTFSNVRTIIKDNEDNLWLGGNNGLWSYNNKLYTHYTEEFTGYIYQDSQENIWTTSVDSANNENWAVSKYDKIAQQNKGATVQKVKTEKNLFFGILEDKKGGIWMGHLRGIYRYDGLLFNAFTFNPPQIHE